MNPIIQVVAGLVLNERGEVLISSRPEGKSYAGYWEFAGGKVEQGETLLQALQREFREELNLNIRHATLWQEKIHHYEHVSVNLHFFIIRANDWDGELIARENQSAVWQNPQNPTVSPLLPANEVILREFSDWMMKNLT